MTNFDYLMKEPGFISFANPAATAEKIFSIDPASALFNIRKAAEQGLRFMIGMEKLDLPEDISFYDALTNPKVQELLDDELLAALHFIRKIGNQAVHGDKATDRKRVIAAFQSLFGFLNWLAYLYSPPANNVYDDRRRYSLSILEKAGSEPAGPDHSQDENLSLKDAEIARLRKQLEEARKNSQTITKKEPSFPLEEQTRHEYIDVMLENAGWKKGSDWLEEVTITDMPTSSGKGRADYILYGTDGKPLAVIEAKKTTRDLSEGRQQARLYADSLERQYGRRPVIFLSNGIETRIIDGTYPERRVSDFYSPRDLERLFNHRQLKRDLFPVHSSDAIAGRYYQKAAITNVCQELENKRRKALLVMATGSGKTRTAAALIDWLNRQNWVTNVLFLADRTMLVSQAKNAIVNNLPNMSVSSLVDKNKDPNARVILSTYQTMLSCIDKTEDEKGRIFTPGHFDLIICDEVHRSIYNKYQDILQYFDAPIIGLTATPKEEIDRDTYKMFELDRGDPTYAYTLEQGIKDGVLVPYQVVETKTKFIDEGIAYDDLDEYEKEDYEKRFADSDGKLPERISADKLNATLFNEDTIRIVLAFVMENGLKVDYGSKIGKTIIFARNHRHAEMILRVFHQQYAYLGNDFAQIIDNQSYDSEQLKADFEQTNKLPQIAISVDMLDTGVDVPAVLNLVFFRRVLSHTKFWQMIGRGTRLCPGLIDGQDKKEFRIFDFFGNFEYFDHHPHQINGSVQMPIQGAIFMTKMKMAQALQESQYQTEPMQNYRVQLVESMCEQVNALNRTAFNVHQHLALVDRFSKKSGFSKLSTQDIMNAEKELAHLIHPITDNIQAVRFDALMYGLELDYLRHVSSSAAWKDLRAKAKALLYDYSDIPAVAAQVDQLRKIVDTESQYVEQADLETLEQIRKELRPLMKFIIKEAQEIYYTDYQDVLKEATIRPGIQETNDLESYKERAEKFIRENENHAAIKKLRTNQPLTMKDYQELEKVLWKEVGTKADYEAEFYDRPIGEFVRSITGLDRQAANEAFARYIDEAELDPDQINFVHQIIDYVVENGTIDTRVLMESPFTDYGGVRLFEHQMDEWAKVMQSIREINDRADHPYSLQA